MEGVALAAPAARMRVWAVDLDHADLPGAQLAHRPAAYEPVDSPPSTAIGPNACSHASNCRLPSSVLAKLRTPSNRPRSSNAAASWVSVWASTPPMTDPLGLVILWLPSFQSSGRHRLGRADRTVTRHVMQAGSD